jgi:MFS family permease
MKAERTGLLGALQREYRRLPRLYWTLWLGMLINRTGGFVVPFLALYVTARGGSEADAGWILALYGAGSVLAGLTGGVLADRHGRRVTMLGSLFGGAAALLGMGLCRSLWWLGGFTFVMGWAVDLYRPAVAAAIADIVPAPDRERAYGHFYWAINLGFALASMIGGFVASLNQLALFALDAATMLAFAVLVLTRVPETRPAGLERSASLLLTSASGLGRVLADRTFIGFCVMSFGTAIVMWQNGVALPLDMRRHGIDISTFGLLMSINGIIIIAVQPLLTPRLARIPRTAVLAVAALLFGMGFGLYAVVDGVGGYALAVTLWTLAEIALLPTGSSVVADLAPGALRGRYQGVYSMSWGLASCVGPVLGGAVLARQGGVSLWLGCFVLMLAVSIGHLLIGPERTRREQRARAAS